MKKSLLALAVLGAFAGVASAQSSVTLYGTVDVNGRVRQGRRPRPSLLDASQDGINSSQLGFRGVEDLGGGLKAGFNLLRRRQRRHRHAPQQRASSSIVVRPSACSGNFGELRLGRDYTPTFWNLTIFDAFGTNGLGSSLQRPPAATAAPAGQLDRLLPAVEPRRLLRPGRWSRPAKAARRPRQARPLRRWPRRLRRGPVRRRWCVREAKFNAAISADRRSADDKQKTWNVGGS